MYSRLSNIKIRKIDGEIFKFFFLANTLKFSMRDMRLNLNNTK